MVVPLGILLALLDELFVEHGTADLGVDLVRVDLVVLNDNDGQFLPVLLYHESGHDDDEVLLDEFVLVEDFLIDDEAALEFAESIAEFASR